MLSSMEDIRERIMKIMGFTKKGDVAKALGLDAPSLSHSKTEDGIPGKPLRAIITYCENNNLSLDYILSGRECSILKSETNEQNEQSKEELIELPIHTNSLMSNHVVQKPIFVISIDKRFYSTGLSAFMVSGHAMYELIPDGSVVVVNTEERDIISGEIYLIKLPYELQVRRVYSTETGLMLKPENPAYETINLGQNHIKEDTIQGRVVSFLSRRGFPRI